MKIVDCLPDRLKVLSKYLDKLQQVRLVANFPVKVKIDGANFYLSQNGLQKGTCGAVSGACVLAGLKNSTGNMTKPNSKTSTYKLSREIMARFKSMNTTTVCKELKGVDTGVLIRKCPDCIRDAAKIVEDVIFNEL